MARPPSFVAMDAFDAALTPRRPSRTVLGFTAMGLLGVLAVAVSIAAAGPVPFALAVGLAVLPVPLLVMVVLTLDRLEPEPTRNLVLAFVFGATVAAVLAGLLNTVGLSIVGTFVGEDAALPVYATAGAPIIEELLKGLVLFGYLLFRHQELDGPTDGIVYACMVGLGFALTENIDYYLLALIEGGAGDLAFTFVLRGVFSPFLHPLFTSMTGIALGYAALQRRVSVRIVLCLLGLVAAISLHALWNGAASVGLPALLLLYFAVMVPAIIAVLTVTRLDRARMGRLIRRVLPFVVPAGLVTEDDITMLSTIACRRAARVQARERGGRSAERAVRTYQQAATELVLAHDRVARGVAEPGWIERRRELLVPLMLKARADAHR